MTVRQTVERRKISVALQDARRVLEAMSSGHIETVVQTSGGSYFSGKAMNEICKVENPEQLTEAELLRRVRSFAPVLIRIGSKIYPVTSLRPARGQSLSFLTADGVSAYTQTGFITCQRNFFYFCSVLSGLDGFFQNDLSQRFKMQKTDVTQRRTTFLVSRGVRYRAVTWAVLTGHPPCRVGWAFGCARYENTCYYRRWWQCEFVDLYCDSSGFCIED